MSIKTINFGILSKHYIKFQEGLLVINAKKKEFLDKLEPLKVSMNAIMQASQRGEAISMQEQEEFKVLQDDAISLDNDFKYTMGKMNDDLSKEIYGQLSVLINEWSESNDVDMVINSSEVVFYKEELDITNNILEVLKEKGLYI